MGKSWGGMGNRKWKEKTNTPSQIPTQLLSLANALGFRPIKLSDRMNYVFSHQPNLRQETVAPSPQLTLDQLVKRLRRIIYPRMPPTHRPPSRRTDTAALFLPGIAGSPEQQQQQGKLAAEHRELYIPT